MLQPNLFGHGHYAAYDAILTSLWVLSIIAFAQAVPPSVDPNASRRSARWGWVLAFGLHSRLRRRRPSSRAGSCRCRFWSGRAFIAAGGVHDIASSGGLIAIAVLFVLDAPMVDRSGQRRASVPGIQPEPRHDAGRSRSSFWAPSTTPPENRSRGTTRSSGPCSSHPVGFLIMAVVGLWRALRTWRSEPIGLLIAGHWAFLMMLRALPHTPGHDGVRLFLPAFGVLALLGGSERDRCSTRGAAGLSRPSPRPCSKGVVSIAVMMPVPLSYFSPLVGGLPGATALGMEPTYYWDALGPDARRWLFRAHGTVRRPSSSPRFPTHGSICGRRVHCRNVWPRSIAGRPKWYVLQNRPGPSRPIDRIARRYMASRLTRSPSWASH